MAVILGLSYGNLDSSAALVCKGDVQATELEKSFSGKPRDPSFPIQSINKCLQQANAIIRDVQYIAVGDKPYSRFHRTIIEHFLSWPFSLKSFLQDIPVWMAERLIAPIFIKESLGFKGQIFFLRNFQAQAAASFYSSGFHDAAILVSDIAGEWTSLSWGFGKGNGFKLHEDQCFPHSLALLSLAIADHLGVEYNILSYDIDSISLNESEFSKILNDIVKINANGIVQINWKYFDFSSGKLSFSRRFSDVFGPPRSKEEPLTSQHQSLILSFRLLVEHTMLNVIKYVFQQSKTNKLCLAGSSFTNPSFIRKLREHSPFDEIYAPSVLGDASVSIGSALYIDRHSVNGGDIC